MVVLPDMQQEYLAQLRVLNLIETK